MSLLWKNVAQSARHKPATASQDYYYYDYHHITMNLRKICLKGTVHLPRHQQSRSPSLYFSGMSNPSEPIGWIVQFTCCTECADSWPIRRGSGEAGRCPATSSVPIESISCVLEFSTRVAPAAHLFWRRRFVSIEGGQTVI